MPIVITSSISGEKFNQIDGDYLGNDVLYYIKLSWTAKESQKHETYIFGIVESKVFLSVATRI